MKPENLKLLLDKYIESIPAVRDERGKFPFREQLRKDIKAFCEQVLESQLKSIAVYGTNTHSYAEAQAFLIEFRRIV